MNNEQTESQPKSQSRKPKGKRARTTIEALESRVMLSVTAGHDAAAAAGATANLSSGPELGQAVHDLIVVDATLARRGLVPATQGHARVVLLDDHADVLGQITRALKSAGRVRSLHILTHGQSGELRVGSQVIDAELLARRSGEVAAWGASLTPTASIAIYGCDVAEGASGRAFVQALARRTGATVAASTDLTGAAARGGDWTLEYVAGHDAVHALRVNGFDGLLATFTVNASAGAATHVVGTGASVIDAGLAVASSDPAATYATATVRVTGNYYNGQDVLALGTASGFTGAFDAATGTLTVTAAGGKTAADFQQALRTVTYQATQTAFADLHDRQITFAFNGVMSAKAVTPDLPVDSQIQARIVDAFNVIDQIGQKIVGANAQPYRNSTTNVPVIDQRLTDLLYPNSPTLDANGNAVPDLSKSIQPAGIGAYLQLKSTVQTYFAAAGTAITNLDGLQAALQAYLNATVQGSKSTLRVDATFAKPLGNDVRRIDLTVTILTAKGDTRALQLDQLARDLNLKPGANATVQAGGGADIAFTISLDLTGHTYGTGATAVAAGNVGVSFARLNAFAGYALGATPFDVTLGAIRGTVSNASGSLGVIIPVSLGGGGNTRTLAGWHTDGTDYSGFGTLRGAANLVLPISAGIGGVSATTADTKIVYTDADLFDAATPTYATTDFGALQYFANVRIDDVINQVLKVGDLFDSLSNAGEDQFGLYVPTVKDTTLGDLFDFKSLFAAAIGSKIDVYQPTLATPGRDALTDYRLPLSGDATPSAAMWSDLRAGFDFGVVLNEDGVVHPVSIAADDTRSSLDDLVADVNTAFASAGLALAASNVKNKMSITATTVATQRFAVVPVATSSARQNPTDAPATGGTLVLNTPQYFTVTGSTTGTVTGTNYYTLASSIAAAAVHSGVLKAGETGVVKVTRLAGKSVVGSVRNGVTSAAGSGDVYLIESGVSDLRRLGLVAYDTPLGVLESMSGGGIRGTMPLAADLSASGSIKVTGGSNDYTVDLPDNGRTSVLDTLGDVRHALAAAGISAASLDARLVDAAGNAVTTEPAAGTNVYLQLFLPEGSGWTQFSLAPTTEATADRVLPLGFLAGDTAARVRPAALASFDDFANASLFPGLSIAPVYDAAAGTVTLEFTASRDASKSVKAAFDLALKNLGSITAADANLSFTAVVHSELAFGLQFKIGPEKPTALASAATLPADGRLSADANFSLNFVLQDRYAVSLPQSWTAGNGNVQDLVGDLNRAFKQTTNVAGNAADITDRFVARRLEGNNQLELTTATPANGGSAYTLANTGGKLAADVTMNFYQDGVTYTVTVPKSATTGNTSFADLVLDANAALGTAKNAAGQTVSLTGAMFFTTLSTAGGGADNNLYLYATTPAATGWPTTVVLSAARTDAAVTTLGFDDQGDADTSIVLARAGTGDAKLVSHGNGKPLAGGTVDISYPSFAGSVPYGFNTLNFGGTTGGFTAGASVSLGTGVATIDEIAANLTGRLARTLTGANGSGRARAVLSLETVTADGVTVDPAATVAVTVPDIGATTVIQDVAIGVPIPVAGQLHGRLTATRTVNFISNGASYAVTVTKAESSSNASFGDLVTQFNNKLAAATKTVGGVTSTVDVSGQFKIAADMGATGDQVIVSVATPTANPDFARVSFLPGISAFGEIGAQGSFGLSTVADSLTDVIPLLDGLQSDLDLFSTFKLPLVDLHVNDLIDVKTGLMEKIDTLRDVKIAGPSQIAGAISQALGIPADCVAVMYDDANHAYRIDLQWDTGVATAKAMNLSLADFYRFTGEEPPAGLTDFNDAGNSSPLAIKIKAVTTLALGIDLTDPDAPRTFLYGHDGSDDTQLDDGSANGTSIALEVEAKADDINFTAALGAFGIFVRGGTAELGGVARTFNDDPIYTFDEATKQLHFAKDTDGALLTVKLGEAGEKYYLEPQSGEGDAYKKDNYATAYQGTVEANLPLFTPTEYINPFTNRTEHVRIQGQGMTDVHPGGNIFQLHIADLQAYADASLDLVKYQGEISDLYAEAGNAALSPAQTAAVNDLQAAIDALKNDDVLSVFTPDVDDANSGVKAPTLLDLVRDPAILVDGIDVALGSVQSGLSALDNLNIPLIGNVLGDAVDGVFDWRKGWLLDLKHELRGTGESFFQTLKSEVYDFLGPGGANLLLKDNGIRSVDGMQQADSSDDVTLDFLDADGNKMTGLDGYGAEAVQFKVRLGQVLLNTGTDISFDFDALKPAFSLKLNGGLTFKLGWDMTIGFGVSLKDGFYLVTDSDPSANEAELRFEAGLSGQQTGFTVAERAGSLSGYSIQDAAGNWVYGPRQGDGSSSILDVMPVDENGDDYDFSLGLPVKPQDCGEDEPAEGEPGHVYWVVAMDDGHGNAEPAYLDKLGQYRAMAGDTWQDVNGGDDGRNPDKMVEYNQTAPFAAFGSLFALNLAAIDTIKTGLSAKGDADYYYSGEAGQISSGQRNDDETGVNRNNDLPTRIAGRIGVNIEDPSVASGDYVARPGPSATGFVLMDGTTALGGEPVLDDAGEMIPVKMIGNDWYVMEPDPEAAANDPDPELVEAYLITEDQSPNRITYNEIQEAGTKIFELKVNAEAVLNLKMVLSVSENADIPRITADLNIDWRTDSMKPPSNPFATDEEQQRDLVPELGVNNIRLDLGSFLTKFIKPIADEVDKTLKPLDPLIDVLNASLPVLSDIAGRPIKLTTLLTTFGGAQGQAVATMLDMVVLVRQLSGVMANVPDGVNVYLPIGNFWLAKVGAGPFGRPGLGTQIYYDNSEVSAPSITQRNQSLIANSGQAANSVTNALGKLDQLDSGTSSQPGVSQADRGGFNIPMLSEPMTLFKMLMGENVPLVTFSLPKLDFNFSTDIPLARIIILQVGLRFSLQMKGQLAIGYDTYGLKLFADSHDAEDLLEGFYVSDRANADGTGADVDEFYLKATIALYGEVDLVLAKAGIEGGFTFEAHVNLNDPDNDGKLRVMEAVDLVKYTHNPLDLADLSFSGQIYAKYYYWVGLKIWTPWKTYQITLVEGGKTFARLTVFSFTRDGRDGPPVLGAKVTTITEDGTETPNSLLLNFGPNSAKRISNEDPLALKDAAERVKIWNDAPGSKTIHVQYLNYSGSYVQTFSDISRVVMYGGQGNDTIDASGLNGIPVEFDGGAGDDTIYLGSGSAAYDSVIRGGAGRDVVRVAGGGKMRIEGDDGDDNLTGGDNAQTTLDGGNGNDTVAGGAGGNNTFKFRKSFGKDNLVLNSTALVNLIDLIDSSLPATLNLHSVDSTIKAGDTNSVNFDFGKVTEIRGSAGRDTFNVTDPATRAANGDRGVVLAGGPGDDLYNLTANDLSAMNARGITIDDDIAPTAVASVGDTVVDECGCLTDIKIASGGSGYVQAPDVIIQDPTGTGARAVASIDKNGVVTGVYVLDKGENYSNPTVTLVRDISTGDKISFNSNTTHTVSMDRQANGVGDSELKLDNRAFKWVGNKAPGVVRGDTYGVNEIDKLSVNLPTGRLELNESVDLEDKLEVVARDFDQRAAIYADTVSITTDRGFAADYPINTTNNGDVTLRVTGKVDADDITTQAVVTANVVGGVITGFNIVDGGSGYTFAPTLTIDDPRGAGGRAITTVTNGVVTGVTLLDGGGYLSVPAPKVTVAHPDSIQLNNNLTSSTVGSLPGDGDGRGTMTLRAENGAINTSGDVAFSPGNKVLWEHGDYRYTSDKTLKDITPTTDPATVGGQGATAVALLDDDGRVVGFNLTNAGSGYSRAFLPSVEIEGGATATAIVDDATGKLTGFNITYPGDGYSNAPRVKIVSNGFGKIVGTTAAETLANRMAIKAAGGSLIAVAYQDIGSSSKPLKTDVENMVGQSFENGSAIYVLEKDGVRIGDIQHINGLNTVNGNIGVTTFGGAISLGQPVQQVNASGELLWQDANKTVPIYAKDENGKIIYKGGRLQSGSGDIKLTADDIDVNSYVGATGGTLTLQPVDPSAVIGLAGTAARATLAVSNGQVTGTSQLWSGRGYNRLPTITIAPPGERAFGVANVHDGRLQSINVTFGGTNYNADYPPTITLTGGGLNGGAPTTPATVEPVYTDGVVTGVTITGGGAGYYTAPTVNFALPGVQATALSQVINGRISEIQIINTGANYQTPPEIKITAPTDFSLEKEEVQYFEDGFGNIMIGRADGRHVFYSADAGFVDGVTLRGPRAGGEVELENLRSSDGPVVVIGSGHTLNLTSASPAVSGTFVEIDDNIVVHNDVDAVITGTSDYVSIFGSAKGKIDGEAGSTTENLTINDVGNVLVAGAIGSTNPIHNLTINSSGAGTINLQQSVTIEGDLHIVKGGDINFGGNLSIGGSLIIDDGASVSFGGSISIGGTLTIKKASTVTFAKNLNVTGAINIGDSMNPSAVEGVTFSATARLDTAGLVSIFAADDIVFGNRVGQITQPSGMVLRSDLGDVSFQASVNLPNGPLTIQKARDVTFAQELTAATLDVQNATGQTRFERAVVVGTMTVTSTSLVQIKNRMDIKTGGLTLTTDDVDFAGGNGSINYVGTGQGTMTVRPRTLARDITVGSPPGVFSALDISDVDLAAVGPTFAELAIGNAAAGTGTVTIGSVGSQQGAGNSQFVTSTRVYGGTINVVQAIDSAAAAGVLKLVARTGDVNINARVNGTAAERNAQVVLQTLAGNVNLNQPVSATAQVGIYSAGAVTEGVNAFVTADRLGVVAGGAVTMTHASNAIRTLAINTANAAIDFRNDPAFTIGTVDAINGVSSGTANTTLASVGGVVTQTQPVVAGGLLLKGVGATFTLNNPANDVDTLAADTGTLAFTDADDLTVGTVGAKNGIATAGATTLTAATDLTLAKPLATAGGDITLAATAGSVNAGTTGNLTAGGSGKLTATAANDVTLAAATTGGNLAVTAGRDFVENGPIAVTGNAGVAAGRGLTTTGAFAATGTVSFDAGAGVGVQAVTAGGDVTVHAGTSADLGDRLQSGGAVAVIAAAGHVAMSADGAIGAAGKVSLTASDDVALQTVTAGDDVTVRAGHAVAVNAAVNARGTVDMNAATGTLEMTPAATIEATGNVVLTATDNVITQSVIAGGDLTAHGGLAVTLGALTKANGKIDLAAAGGDVVMAAGGSVVGGGDVLASAADDLSARTVTAGGNVRLRAGQGVGLHAPVTATGWVDVEAEDGAAVMADDALVSAGGYAKFVATDDVVTQAVTAGGDVTVRAGQAATLSDLVQAGGAVDLAAAAAALTMATGSSVTAAGAVTMNAATDLFTRTVTATGDVLLHAGNGVTVRAPVNSRGSVDATADAGTLMMTGTGSFEAVGHVVLTASGDVSTQAVTAGGNATVHAGNALSVTAPVRSAAVVDLAAANGDVTMGVDAAVVAAGDVGIHAAADVTTRAITADGNVVVQGDGIQANGTLRSRRNVSLTAVQDSVTMTPGSRVIASLDTTMTAVDDVTTEAVTARNLTVRAGRNAFVNDTIGTGTNADIAAALGDVTMAADAGVTAGGLVLLTAAGDVNATAIDAVGNVTVHAGLRAAIGAGVQSGGNVEIASTDRAVVMAAGSSVASTGDVRMNAADDVVTRDITANGDVTLRGGDGVLLNGDVSARGVTATAVRDSVVMAADGTISATGPVSLTAADDVSTEAVTAGSVTARAGQGVAVNAAVKSLGVVDLAAAAGSVSMAADSSINAKADVTLAAGGDVATMNVVSGGNVTVNADGSATLGDDLAAGGNVLVVTRDDSITVVPDAAVVAAGSVTMRSGDALQTRLIDAGTGVTLTSNWAMALSGDVTSHRGPAAFTSRNADIAMLPGTGISAGGAASFNAATSLSLHKVDAGSITATAGADSIFRNTLTTHDSGAVTVNVTGLLTVQEGADISSDGDVNVSATRGVFTAANVATTADAININSALLLGDNVAITSGKRGDGPITFGGTVDGAFDLSLRSGTDVAFNGDVGQATALRKLDVLGARDVSLSTRITAGTIRQADGTGVTTVSGAVAALDAAGLAIKNAAVSVSGTLAANADKAPLTVQTGNLRLMRKARLSSGGEMNLKATVFKGDDGYSASVAGGNAMVLTVDTVDLGTRAEALGGTGVIVIQPSGLTTPVSVGANGTGFDLSADEMNTIGSGFTKLVIGRGQDADYDSGDTGSNAVTVGNVAVNLPVVIRSNGAAGSIRVDGTLSSLNKGGDITLTAGGDVAVNGAVRAVRSGTIRIAADADANAKGTAGVGQSTNAAVNTPSGQILIVGPAVRIGSGTTLADVRAGGNVLLGTYSAKGTVVVSNPKTVVSGQDVALAANGAGTVNPRSVTVRSTITAAGVLTLHAQSDVNLASARLVGNNGLNVLGDAGITSTNVALVARNGGLKFNPDADGDKKGTATVTDTRTSEPTSLDLRARFNETRLPSKIVPGTRGETYVVVGNNTRKPATGMVTVYVYASTDGVLDGADRVIGSFRKKVTIAAGDSQTFKVLLRVPADMAAGSYRLIAEAMPYATQESAVGSNVGVGDAIVVRAA